MSAHIIEKTQSAYRFPLLIRSLFRSAMNLDTSEEIVQPGVVRRSYREFGERVHRLASALADIDAFLQTWVPKITGSPAFRRDGLLEITFDESDGPQSDSSACCAEQPGPGSPLPGITGPGGGKVGAVLLSPYIKPGTVSTVPYNHYSSLASWESLFGLSRLADAVTVSSTFGSDVFSNAPG